MSGTSVSPVARKASIAGSLAFAALLACAASAQESPNPTAGSPYPIDLATTLRLAGVQNLDVQLARNAVDEAHANYASALERFLPSLVPSASYLRHTGRDQRVEGPLLDVSKHSESAGTYLIAQIPVGDAIFTSLQTQYSLVERNIEREHVPLCSKEGLGILPWSPLAGGFLSGKYRKDMAPPPGTRLDKWKDRFGSFDVPRNWKILDAVTAAAHELSTTPSAVSLAWLLGKPAVTSVIFGARTVAQLEDNLKAQDLKLSPEWMARLDEASAFELGYPYDFIARIQGRW